MTKQRPFGVTVLAILAAIAAIIAIVHTLQMLHLFPIRGPFGVFAFFTFDLLGAILWGIMALIYIWVMNKLLSLDPQGWLFLAAIATINLIMAVISILGRSSWQAMLPAIIVNGLILIYTLLPSTKEAFGITDAPPASAVPAAPVEPAPVKPAVQEVPAAEPAVAASAGSVMAVQQAAAEEEMPAVEEAVPAPAEPEDISFGVQEMEEEAGPSSEKMVTGAAAMTHDLSYVEGIGDVYGGKLKEAGVDSPQVLLERGATPKGRKELAEAAGISEHLILKWVNHVDLYRIKGVGSEYADLLEAAGVDTVVELAQRNPQNLHAKVAEVNQEKHLVRHLPTQSQIEEWVEQAKQLPRAVSY